MPALPLLPLCRATGRFSNGPQGPSRTDRQRDQDYATRRAVRLDPSICAPTRTRT